MRHSHKEHKEGLSRDERIGVWITEHVGTMSCAYLFSVIGASGVYGAIGGNASLVLIVGSISGYFLQLVLLPVIMVGQNVQARHDQIKADIRYEVDLEIVERLERVEQYLKKYDEN